MRIDVFTLFPEWFDWFKDQRQISTAVSLGHQLNLFNYRDYTSLSHGQVDDTPYGGGPGMVLRVDAVDASLRAVYGEDFDPKSSDCEQRVALLSPAGRLLSESLVEELLGQRALTLLCGRYEGFDQRIHENLCSEEISVGRYVLSGGELAAMVTVDALFRKLPGVLGDDQSSDEESFSEALCGAPEYPHYTRPEEYRSWSVPQLLRSGDHAEIKKWRLERSRERQVGGSDR